MLEIMITRNESLSIIAGIVVIIGFLVLFLLNRKDKKKFNRAFYEHKTDIESMTTKTSDSTPAAINLKKNENTEEQNRFIEEYYKKMKDNDT